MADLEADARAVAKVLSRGGYSYQSAKGLMKRARQLAGLRAPTHKGGIIERLTEDEMRAFVAAAYDAAGVRGLMVQTLLLTGLRVSEFVSLRIEDVAWREQAIYVENGKGGKRRRVRMPEALAQALRVHVGERQAGPLFVSSHGGAYTPRRVQQIVKEVAGAAGIVRRVYPHLLRHTYAMDLRRRGVPVDVIRDVLGHEQISTTQHYYGEDPARVDAEIARAFGEVR